MDMGKAIILKKKDGEKVYPISASDLIFNPETKKNVKQELAEKIGDAPSDGKQYVRKNGAWGEVDIPESGIGEAPKDGKQYVRKDGNWELISTNEICQITLNSNQGDSDAASLIGASVKIVSVEDGSELYNGTWNGETIILGIKQGTEYKIVAGVVDGYAAPSEQTYTAAAFVNRDVELMYNTEIVTVNVSSGDGSNVDGQIVSLKHGQYIEDTDGNLYSKEQWDGTKTANSIVLLYDNFQARLALTQHTEPNNNPIYIGYNNGIPLITTKEDAINHYNFTEAAQFLSANTLEHYRAILPSGQYADNSPTLGMVLDIYDNLDAINELLEISGGEVIPDNVMLDTSTIYSDDAARSYKWMVKPETKEITNEYHYSYSVLRFAPINDEYPIKYDFRKEYIVTNGRVEFKAPFGAEYTVSINEKSGYITPASQTFTAAKSVRDLAIVYSNDDYGVYIQSIEGGLYHVDRWDGTKTPNGIAVITDKTRFVISKDGNSTLAITTDDFAGAKYKQYLTSFTTSTDAKKDYKGEDNTNNMIKVLSDTGKAAGFCKNFTFPNGKKGFLPSLGQMNAAYNNKNAVDAALAKIGGDAFVINGTAYKTSTLGIVYSDGSGGFWIFRWNDGHSESYSPLNGHAVRVFTSI